MIAIFAIQNSSVQNYISKRAASFLSKELNTSISVDALTLKSFRSFEVKNLLVLDKAGQPMINVPEATAQISLARILSNRVSIRKVILQDAFVNYEIYKDSSNFTFLANYFAPPTTKQAINSKKLSVDLTDIELINNRIKLTNHRYKPKKEGLDISNLDLTSISVKISDIQLADTASQARIAELTFQDRSGLILHELSSQVHLSKHKMEFAALSLRTNRSRLGNYIAFTYSDIEDFADFINKVNVQSELSQSFIDSRDIQIFAPKMKGVRFATAINMASLSGTVEHIKAKDVDLKMTNSTNLIGDFTIDGLPHIDKTKFDFDLKEFSTSSIDVEEIVPDLTNQNSFEIPELLHRLGAIKYKGSLSGYYHQFTAKGKTETDLGAIDTDFKISLKPSFQYDGNLTSDNFEIGDLLNNTALSSTALNINFDGKGLDINNLQLTANGELKDLNFNGYTYQQIDFDTEVNQGILYSNAEVNDSFVRLTFDSEINWQDKTPVYNFSTAIDLLNLKNTHLFKKDSVILKNSTINAQFAGSTLNSITGKLASKQVQFSSLRGDFTVNDFVLESKESNKVKTLSITSDALDSEMSGQIDLPTLGNYFSSLAMRYAPAINIEAKPYHAQNFNLNILVKKFKPISALFNANLDMEDGSRLTARFSSDHYKANFNAYSPRVNYKGMTLSNLLLIENADDKAFSLDITADRFSLSDSAYVEGVKINNVLANDSLHFNILLSEEQRSNHLNLLGNIHFEHNKPAYIKFNNSKIVLNNEEWLINEEADLRVSKGKFYLNNLLLKHKQQEVAINGILSDQNDDMNIMFKDFSLMALSGITKPLGIELQGQMNGDITINSIFRTPNLSAHIVTSPIVYNSLPIGSLYIDADYDPITGLVKLDSRLTDMNQNGINLGGTYNVNAETDGLRLNGNVKNIDLAVAQPFLRSLVTDLYGKISGDVSIRGSVQKPIINGRINIQEASFLVKYLQTQYTLSNQSVLLDQNTFVLADLQIRDSRHALATAQGNINMNILSDPNLNIAVTADNFQVLNTSRKHNELFYGLAYATGKFQFTGQTSAINIDIDAQSNPNTVITIPFNSSSTISDNDFIYFANPNSPKGAASLRKPVFKGLTMNMDLEITRETEINLENNVGSLKGLGTGNLSLRISSLGDFEMFGDYHVVSGKFHFTAQDFFNKYFDLKEGGTIRWAGIPSEATVNLSATYEQRTSVAPLYNAAGHSENNARTLAQATMILRGSLTQPEISFDLNFPQDPYIKDELQGYLSDGNSVNQQAISLIVRRSFTPASTQEFGREVNNTLLSAGTEIAFNQLNNIISQSLNMNFLDLNIRSFNDASASLRFFDDRLILTGGVSDRSNATMNDLNIFSDQIATDAELTFRLRQDGNLVLRAYNRLNTKSVLFNPYSDYISAVGIVYRQEFNSLSEFWRKMWIWKDRKNKRKKVVTDADSTASFINFK